MIATDSALQAFGGGALAGDKWVRVLYLDESGVGKVEHDPILVVAGVLIHADTQWGAIANRLRRLLEEAVPKGQPTPRYLHATDIYHGSGEFSRQHWPEKVRNGLLNDLAKLPDEFNLPVVWGAIDRRRLAREHPESTPNEIKRDAYSVASLVCFLQAEEYLRCLPDEAEVASIVMEQNQELQKRLPELVGFFMSPDSFEGLVPYARDYLPLRRIIDAPAYQPKSASSILQLADFCAFAIKRRMQGKAGGARLVAPFAHQLIVLKEAGEGRESAVWNPHVVPAKWGNKIAFRNGAFVFKE